MRTSRRNAVARLQERLAARETGLDYDDRSGYLPSLLKALDVPVSSQVLVFSKTSFQAARIHPANPRAIYFNDSVAIGHVPGSDLLELTDIADRRFKPAGRSVARFSRVRAISCSDSVTVVTSSWWIASRRLRTSLA